MALQYHALVAGRSLKFQLDRLIRLRIPLADLVGFDEQCREVVNQNPGISFARVIDPSGQVLFHNDPGQQGRRIESAQLLRDIGAKTERVNLYEDDVNGQFYSAAIPVFGEMEELVATVNIGFPTEVIAGKTRKIVGNSTIAAAFFFSIGSLSILMFLGIWVTRPLKKLMAVIRDIMRDGVDSARLLETGSRDEIGQLAKAFNQMILDLQRSHRLNLEYAETLEAKVRLRTEDLDRANENLRLDLQERLRLEAAIEQANEAVVIADRLGTIFYINPAFERITGFDRRDPSGQSLRVLFESDDFFNEVTKTLNQGKGWDGGTHPLTRDGSRIAIDVSITPMRDSSGGIGDVVAVVKDVTREELIEKQLRQAHKMESIGNLAGGIAHDFNNMLSVIVGYTELALSELKEDHRARESLEQISSAANRAAGLTRQILAFSRKQVISPEVVSLNDLLEDTRKMLGRLIGENIDLATLLAPELNPVKVDPGQMEQVIFNLAVNSRDAMPNGGRLTVETANVELTETFRAEHYEVVPGQYILMSVSDTGIGMDEEIQAKVFEPFFTTKEVGKGTGMGLATVYGIVKQNRGYIYVASSPGKGTTFTVYLPVHEGEPERVRVEADLSPQSAAGGETILVVEDDPALLDLICRTLADHGYRILKAENGDRALEVSDNHPGAIDLILTDIIMPGVDVRDMVRLIHAARKDTKILYISGYTDDTIAPYGVLEEGLSFLGKPFTPYELLLKIRQVLVHGAPQSERVCGPHGNGPPNPN